MRWCPSVNPWPRRQCSWDSTTDLRREPSLHRGFVEVLVQARDAALLDFADDAGGKFESAAIVSMGDENMLLDEARRCHLHTPIFIQTIRRASDQPTKHLEVLSHRGVRAVGV